jgi:hypothetical protein
MANTENIEAKLCAYVDGDLDDAGRAEIEAHLATNPQHRQLLEELKAQHAMLSTLPRARAPEDLSDAFQAQLERSVLLDESHASAPVAGRINHTPQIFAAAAVLLLAVGLVAVILMVLPARRRSPQVAIHSPSASAPTADARRAVRDLGAVPRSPEGSATQPAPAESTSALAGTDGITGTRADRTLARNAAPLKDQGKLGIAMKGAPASIAPAVPASPAEPKSPAAQDVFASRGGSSQSVATPAQTYTNIFAANQQLDEEATDKLKQLNGVPANAPVIIVASDDPTAANQQVQQYLTANNIRWVPLSEPMPSPIDLSQNQAVAPARLQNEIAMRLKTGVQAQQQQTPSAQATAQQQSLQSTSHLEQKQKPTMLGGQLAEKPIPSGERGVKKEVTSDGNVAGIASAAPEQAPVTAAPTSAPSAESPAPPRFGLASDRPQASADKSAQQQIPQQQIAEQQTAQQRPIAPAPMTQPMVIQPHLILARGLTPSQVSELNKAFSNNVMATSPATAPAGASVSSPTTRMYAATAPAAAGMSGSSEGQASSAIPTTQPLDQASRRPTLSDQIHATPAARAPSPMATTPPALAMTPATRPLSETKVDVLIYVQPATSTGQQIIQQSAAPAPPATQPATAPAQ